ncbi:Increased recombination centers protein 6 [Candida viswanathii]|uniref:Increased recombination centers protein 6 n=1 Tax=Candida viswanathii TaxID=5486 RepID=A0A367Y143_9ASCO|nr:Increased recombination centers protein 6 [Candida viswanathii]
MCFLDMLNILIDEYPEDRQKSATDEEKLEELSKWLDEFRSEDFTELREVLDGLVFTINMRTDSIPLSKCFRNCFTSEDSIIGSTPEEELVDDDTVEEIEDLIITNGFEFINLNTEESHDWTNMELLKLDPDQYEKNKLDKVEQMKQNLLEEKEGMDLDVVFNKLSLAKDRAQGMTQGKRKSMQIK